MQIGFPSALFLVFLVLKLMEIIDWSWWWITAPLWLPLAIVGGFWLLAMMFAWLLTRMADRQRAKRRANKAG